MTACSFFIFTVYLSIIFRPSHGFEVIQPQNRTVNPDGSVSISCEHTADVNSVKDVRLNAISITDEPTLLCQKGKKECKNITMHEENPKKWLFIILNIGPEAMSVKYQCEFTVKQDDLDYTQTGAPTILLPGFEVIQPQNRTVNPDGSVSISCEHTADVNSVKDVRLNAISITDKPTLLCQKGKKECKNITMHEENPKKWLFIILNIGPEAMSVKYQCEFTVKQDDLDYTQTGAPTILLPGQQEMTCALHPPPQPESHQLRWILIGLIGPLALTFLYSCVITSFYIRLRCDNREPESSIYVEMRKAQPMNPPFDIYCSR